MALNYIWLAFFLVAFIVALIRLVFFGDFEIFTNLMNNSYETAKTAFELCLGLTGVLTLWLGIMKIGEHGGIVAIFGKWFGPLLRKLFPEIPPNHPSIGPMIMNISANMLGLDNAATPLGLKAMESMQDLNPKKDTASNAQIMFLVLNASGLTILPIMIMVYRAQLGAANPSDVFIPILIATFFSTLAGLVAVSLYQRINLFDKIILAYLGTFSILIASIIYFFVTLEKGKMQMYSSFAGNFILFSVIIAFILLAAKKKVNVYESFIEGAKEGFQVAVKIIPFLVAMLVAIGMFRTSGALDYLVNGMKDLVLWAGLNADFTDALPTAFMKPLSGSGARAMMIDTMKLYGPDSFAGRLSCVFQGSTETTFYILALYFGAVNIRNSRYAVICGLIADLSGFIAAIMVSYIFFH
ncbi:MAG TPA: nucleoside recognition domain-containing protein [Cyclobacteriaceae bacterium]|nr:nucleoside recognition domain-containing protein [Cyclobacteriaceae bacterium]